MSGYRYVTIPAPVTIVDDDGEPVLQSNGKPHVVHFREFLLSRTRDATIFGASLDAIIAMNAIESEFRGKGEGEVVKLPSAEWDLLKAACEKPTGGYNPGIAGQIVSMPLAVRNAPDKQPVATLAAAAE